jgi:hypothetical protein
VINIVVLCDKYDNETKDLRIHFSRVKEIRILTLNATFDMKTFKKENRGNLFS